jgi:carbonic anhydrase
MLPRQRRTKIVLAAAALAVLLGGVYFWRASWSGQITTQPAPTDPDTALAELCNGNARFVKSARTLSTDTAHDAEHRHQTAKKQHPFAVILCCSDSRVCPEFIFDQRVGSMFEVRNAGNVVDEDVLASFEYAVEHFHVPLMLVLAHKGCGAIHAVCEARERPLHGHLRELQKHMSGIQQDISKTHTHHNFDVLNELSKKNARQQALALLRDSPDLKTAVDKGEARLLCGIYDMDTGLVEFYDPHSNRLLSVPYSH